jgi:hypothetical protein
LKPLTSKILKSPATNAEDAIRALLDLRDRTNPQVLRAIDRSWTEPRTLLYGLAPRL